MLAAVAGYFAANGQDFAAAMCVVAVLGSLMVSYTRARAEALGVECKVGLATRPVRVVLLSIGLVFAKGAGIGRLRAAGALDLRDRGADHRHRGPAGMACAKRTFKRGRRADRSVTSQRLPGVALPLSPIEEGFPNFMSESNGKRQRRRAHGREGPRRDRRRRQLRQLLHPGRRVLQGRRPLRGGARA